MVTERLPQSVTEPVRAVLDHRVGGPAVKLLVAAAAVWLVSGGVFGAPAAGIVSGAAIGTLYGILAVAIILIYRTNRIINFAAAALGAVPGVLAALLLVIRGWPWGVAFPLAVVGGALLGGLVDVTVIRRFSRAPRLILTVATIGISQILAFFALKIPIWLGSEGQPISYVPTPFKQIKFSIGKEKFFGDYPFSVLIVLLVVLGLAAFFRYTRVGIALRASAENADRASLLGIPVARVQTVAWVIAGALAGLTIFLRSALVGVPTDGTLGPKVLLFALTAAIVARMDSIPVALVAGIGIGVLAEASVGYAGKDSLASAIMLVVILGALAVQRDRAGRAYDSGVSSFKTVEEFRPTPLELRRVPEVMAMRVGLGVLAAAFLVAFPWIVGEGRISFAIGIVITSIVTVSLVILTGWAGQISLGQYAIVGIGAALGGKMAAEAGLDFFIALVVGVLAGTVVAVLIGLPALRVQGLYLAVTTLAFAAAMQFYFLDRTYRIGELLAPEKSERIRIPVLWERIVLTGDSDVIPGTGYYFLCLGFLGLVLLGARAYRRNRAGRVLIALRDNSRAASSYTINPARTKIAAFAVSGAIASLGGVLLAFEQGQVDASTYGIDKSIFVFMIAVIGGLTSVMGAVVAAFVIEGIRFFGNDVLSGIELLVTGPGLLIVLMFLPGGFAEAIYKTRDGYLRWVAKRRDILVPSLVADKRTEAVIREAEDHVVEHAEERAEETEVLVTGGGS